MRYYVALGYARGQEAISKWKIVFYSKDMELAKERFKKLDWRTEGADAKIMMDENKMVLDSKGTHTSGSTFIRTDSVIIPQDPRSPKMNVKLPCGCTMICAVRLGEDGKVDATIPDQIQVKLTRCVVHRQADTMLALLKDVWEHGLTEKLRIRIGEIIN